MADIEKIVCYSQFPRGGTARPCRATWRSTRAGQEAERGREKRGQRLYCGFHRNTWERQAKWLGLGSLNDVSDPWTTGVVSGRQVWAHT